MKENITHSDIFVRKGNLPAERVMLITWKFRAVECQPQAVKAKPDILRKRKKNDSLYQ